ncbi:hypothetical protein [Polaromonas naphthalenivorans]|nr:hypothetical protein [Polaromonas naphthalenivorans]
MLVSKLLLATSICLMLACPSLFVIAQETDNSTLHQAQAGEPPGTSHSVISTVSDIERYKLDLEIKKFDFEREKYRDSIDIERTKAWISALSIVIPLLVVAATIGFSVRTQKQQADLTRQALQEESQRDFDLKVAEALISAPGPVEAHNRALALKDLLPHRLSSDFANAFEPEKHGRLQAPEGRKEFMRLVAAKPDNKDAIIKLWKELWPGDVWVQKVSSNDSLT